jgi:hypothetical protein
MLRSCRDIFGRQPITGEEQLGPWKNCHSLFGDSSANMAILFSVRGVVVFIVWRENSSFRFYRLVGGAI